MSVISNSLADPRRCWSLIGPTAGYCAFCQSSEQPGVYLERVEDGEVVDSTLRSAYSTFP